MEASRIEPEDIVYDFGLISSLPEIHSNSNTVLGSRKDKRIPELKQLMIHPFPINCFHGGNVTYVFMEAMLHTFVMMLSTPDYATKTSMEIMAMRI